MWYCVKLFSLIVVSSALAIIIWTFFDLKNKFIGDYESRSKENSLDKNASSWTDSSSGAHQENISFSYYLPNGKRLDHVRKSIVNEDHCVLYNFLEHQHKGKFFENGTEFEPISLVLHSTMDYSHYIVDQANSWSDLISYSIFLYPGNEEFLPLLSELHQCHDQTNRKVSIHLVWKAGFGQSSCYNSGLDAILKKIYSHTTDCKDFSLPSVSVKLKGVDNPLSMYPINIMRNEGRRGAHSTLHLVSDIETKFSNNFAAVARPLTRNLLNGTYGKAVLVFRRFEMDTKVAFPESVQQLWDMYLSHSVYEFHQMFFKPGHVIGNMTNWFEYSTQHDDVTVYHVPYYRPQWEPQFIMTAKDPYHLEFVPTRFNDHQTLCHQLCRSSYSFMIMSHVFNIHPGIKRSYSPIEEALTKLGRRQSAAFLRKFNSFLDLHYPRTNATAKCPKMTH